MTYPTRYFYEEVKHKLVTAAGLTSNEPGINWHGSMCKQIKKMTVVDL